ncbi:unnamed protein product [Closterium sp. Yama58-4]|nr:unnamed protein product [Closterium sp. Yama58-4]
MEAIATVRQSNASYHSRGGQLRTGREQQAALQAGSAADGRLCKRGASRAGGQRDGQHGAQRAARGAARQLDGLRGAERAARGAAEPSDEQRGAGRAGRGAAQQIDGRLGAQRAVRGAARQRDGQRGAERAARRAKQGRRAGLWAGRTPVGRAHEGATRALRGR